jgi:hypothetical protein
VHVHALLDAPVSPEALFAWVDDLARYPAWLDLVHTATPLEPPSGGAGEGPAWDVVLQARVGPFRRSKRLRMVRTDLQPGRRARFERREADGRQHAAWALEARTEPHAGGARLEMDLRYDGALWSPPLELLLQRQIATARRRLAELVAPGAS